MKMQESVLRRVRAVEEKNGIKYAKTDGRLYKTLRVFYIILFAYTTAVNLLYIAGMTYVYLGTDNFKNVVNSIVTVSICTALIAVGFVLSFFRFKLAAGIISIVPEIFLIPVFGIALSDSLGFLGFKASFYWRHFAPLALLVILMIFTTVIAVRARIKTEKQYTSFENVSNRLNEINLDEDENSIKEKVHEAIDSKLDGKTIVKEIYVKNKIYNIVVK